MKNDIVLLFLCCFFSTILFSQQTFEGRVIDADDESPLLGANISIDGTLLGTSTDEKGRFSIQSGQFPIILTVSYLGYKTQKVTVLNTTKNAITVRLVPAKTQLSEVVISDKPMITPVSETPYHVKDYVFYNDYIILLVYRNIFKKHSLLLVDENGKTLSECSIKDWKPIRFHEGCLGGIHLMTSSFAVQLYVRGEEILFFPQKIEILVFEAEVEPCVTSTASHVIFVTKKHLSQEIKYTAIDKNKSAEKNIVATIRDEVNIALLEDEQSFQQLKAMVNENSGRSNIGSELGDIVFTQKILYKPVYAPLFEYKDTFFIFDHANHFIKKMNILGETLSDIPIDYDSEKKWRKAIIFDHELGKAYTLFDTQWAIELKEINLLTGEIGNTILLDRPYVSRISIKNDFLFFLYFAPQNGVNVQRLEQMRIF